jgi:hypothetical protein
MLSSDLLLMLVTDSSVQGLKGTADYLAWCYMDKVYINNGQIFMSRMIVTQQIQIISGD